MKTEDNMEPQEYFMMGFRALLKSLTPGTKERRLQTRTHSAAEVDHTRSLWEVEHG